MQNIENGWFEVVKRLLKVTGDIIIQYRAYQFLLAFTVIMSQSCTVSMIQQDIAKNCQFYLIHLHFMPQLVVAPTEFAPRFLE